MEIARVFVKKNCKKHEIFSISCLTISTFTSGDFHTRVGVFRGISFPGIKIVSKALNFNPLSEIKTTIIPLPTHIFYDDQERLSTIR